MAVRTRIRRVQHRLDVAEYAGGGWPMAEAFDCEKRTGQDRYRVLQGAYRTVYSIADADLTVVVAKIGHRSDGYR